MFQKHLSSEHFHTLRRFGKLDLTFTNRIAVLNREYIIHNPSYGEEGTLYAKCISVHPTVLELIESPTIDTLELLSKEEVILLSKMSGEKYVEVKDTIIKNVLSNEVISLDNIGRQKQPLDGFYRISEATCGGSLTNGKGGNFSPTPENIAKYQCQVGRHAPKCTMYSKAKCAVYFLEEAEMHNLSFSPTDLIALMKI
jgi:hypothetical protein